MKPFVLKVAAAIITLTFMDVAAFTGFRAWLDAKAQPVITDDASTAPYNLGVILFGNFDRDGALGRESLRRIDHAATLYSAGKVRAVLCVGGQRPKQGLDGSAKCRARLAELGVPIAAIVANYGSRDTIGNLQETKAIASEQDADALLLISSPVHVWRTKLLFEQRPDLRPAARTDLSGYPRRSVEPARSLIEDWYFIHKGLVSFAVQRLFPKPAYDWLVSRLRPEAPCKLPAYLPQRNPMRDQENNRITTTRSPKSRGRTVYTVDLDMWWHCRWATGGPNSRWKNVDALLDEHYQGHDIAAEVDDYTGRVLDLFAAHDVRATFFILGEMALRFPDVIKRVAAAGHEIACHGMFHVDATTYQRAHFERITSEARERLRELSGQNVTGYRAPNLVLTPWIFEALLNIGFEYDSSICPARSFFGKYADFQHAPSTPFMLELADRRRIPELPVPVMPLARLPSNSGIITRVVGLPWSSLATHLHRRDGDVTYYFHPYEVGERPRLPNENFYLKLFMRNLGRPYLKMLHRFLKANKKYGHVVAADAANALLNQDNPRYWRRRGKRTRRERRDQFAARTVQSPSRRALEMIFDVRRGYFDAAEALPPDTDIAALDRDLTPAWPAKRLNGLEPPIMHFPTSSPMTPAK